MQEVLWRHTTENTSVSPWILALYRINNSSAGQLWHVWSFSVIRWQVFLHSTRFFHQILHEKRACCFIVPWNVHKLSNQVLDSTMENWTPEVLSRLVSRPITNRHMERLEIKNCLRTKSVVFVSFCHVSLRFWRKTSSESSVFLLFLSVRLANSCFLAYEVHFLVLCRQNASRQLATSSGNLVASAQFLVALATSESQFRALRGSREVSKGQWLLG